MKNLPTGIQTLTEIRAMNCIYVDKTELVHKMVTTGKYYFFSRPRRFGKSLLVSTLKELFKGNRLIFSDLWINDKWEWTQTNPVIHISFDALGYSELGLLDVLKSELSAQAKLYGIRLQAKDLKGKFNELLQKLNAKHGKVVLLIDEYDKPIIDYLELATLEQAKINRTILRDFYSVLKNADDLLRLVFITGITKFSKISLFSHLNNLTDITIDEKYGTLAGYTHEELELYFSDYLTDIAAKFSISREELLNKMKIWYNGYSWDGVTRVYNPFGTLNFLSQRDFRNYWFSTGNPKFLVEQMRVQEYYNVENVAASSITFEKFDIENIELISLLFQTGYLTIKEKKYGEDEIILDYPNKEVRESMYQFLMGDLAKNARRTHTGRTMKDLSHAFITDDLPRVHDMLNAILADLPSETYLNQTEGLYHGLVHIVFSYLGMFINSEVHSSQGRADAVVQTNDNVYIFEFKFNKTAAEGMTQIHTQKYADKYRATGKTITGISLNFNATIRRIDGWLVEKL
ncbi:MAG: AAA family ATPase [Saprospiraceae bacterium]|nr:AAA family ATPase [Saprospiraceae bacterium]